MLFISISNLLFISDYVVESLIAAATIRGRRLFHSTSTLERLLFKGGVSSRAASFRGNTYGKLFFS